MDEGELLSHHSPAICRKSSIKLMITTIAEPASPMKKSQVSRCIAKYTSTLTTIFYCERDAQVWMVDSA